MSVHKFDVVVTQQFTVNLDDEKFDEQFMGEFRESFFSFDTLAEHAEHIAQLQARGFIDLTFRPTFIEGYGPSDEMAITLTEGSVEMEATPHAD